MRALVHGQPAGESGERRAGLVGLHHAVRVEGVVGAVHRTEVQVLEGDVPAEAEAPAAPGAYFIQALKRSQLEVFGLARTAWARSLSC